MLEVEVMASPALSCHLVANMIIRSLLLCLALMAPVSDEQPTEGGRPVADAPDDHRLSAAPDPRLLAADSLFARGESRAALREVEAVLRSLSGSAGDHTARGAGGDPSLAYEALWRAASLAVALGVERESGPLAGVPEPPSHWYAVAYDWAEEALALDPQGIEPRYWMIAVLGRQALGAGPREAAAMSDRMLALARANLALDPEHAPTLNALGRLHLEIMSRSGMVRLLGRAFVGGEALEQASWAEARRHLERAVALGPDQSMFLLDLGRYHALRRNRREAIDLLRRAIDVGESRPSDRVFVREARALLLELGVNDGGT